GFRTLVFRDGDEILLQSRDEKPMNRYFPELIAPLAATLSERCVVDGDRDRRGRRARLRDLALAYPSRRVPGEAISVSIAGSSSKTTRPASNLLGAQF